MSRELKAIVYLSKATAVTDHLEVEGLVEVAQKANAKHQVTGFIVYQKDHFLQYIEGSTLAVDQLMKNIRIDKRHQVLTTITIPISTRKFPDWGMRWNRENISIETVLLDYLKALLQPLQITETQQNNVLRMLNGISGHYRKETPQNHNL